VGSRSRARARAKASEVTGPASQAPVPAARAAVPAAKVAEPAAQAGEPASVPRPPTITVASAVEAVEAALVLVAAILAGIDTGRGRSYQLSSGIAITVIGIVMAALLGLVAWGLRRPRRWARTPALLTQLFTGIVGIYLVQGAKYGWGVPAIALAVAGFATLLAPPSTRALTVGLPQPADRHRKR
jgi:hypothetical protein